jgi:hypothetical protein
LNIYTNYAHPEQLSLLNHFNEHQVKYLVFGDFAINTFEKGRPNTHIKLWIDATPKNIERLNEALKKANPNRLYTRLPTAIPHRNESKRILSVGVPNFKVELYPCIAGFKPEDFLSIYQQRINGKVVAWGAKSPFQIISLPQLNINHLYASILKSTSSRKLWDATALEKVAEKYSIDLRNNYQIQSGLPAQSSLTKFQTGTTPNKRDFDWMRKELDIEVVLQHYGYRLDTQKTSLNGVWRIYKTGIKGDKQRLAVCNIAGKYRYKGFCDLNDLGKPYKDEKGNWKRSEGFKGDSIQFIHRMENENWKSTFAVVDQILGDSQYQHKVAKLPPLKEVPESYFLKDTALREADLKETYTPTLLKDNRYLLNRAINIPTLSHPAFVSKVLSVGLKQLAYELIEPLLLNNTKGKSIQLTEGTLLFTKEQLQTDGHGNRLFFARLNGQINSFPFKEEVVNNLLKRLPVKDLVFQNTAFPLFAIDGNLASLDIRNDKFKQFPGVERREALWLSNAHFKLITAYQNIPANACGTLHRNLNTNEICFCYFNQANLPTQISIESNKVAEFFEPLTANRLVLCESPVDALSFAQLNPEMPEERRLYVATCGTPAKYQMEHIQHLLNKNPLAEVIIAQDGDNAGIRFAINYLGLKHPNDQNLFNLTPYITYSAPPIGIQSVQDLMGGPKNGGENNELTGEDNFLKGQNHLRLEISNTLQDVTPHTLQQQHEKFINDLTANLNKFVTKEGNEFKARATQLSHLHTPNKDKLSTHVVISFPNDTNMLIRALNRLSESINQKQSRPLFLISRPSRSQKDFNEILQQRKGEKLPESSLLKLPPLPKSDFTLNQHTVKAQNKVSI